MIKTILTVGPDITMDYINLLEYETMCSINNLWKEDLDRLKT